MANSSSVVYIILRYVNAARLENFTSELRSWEAANWQLHRSRKKLEFSSKKIYKLSNFETL
jgi:hypothetical protein